MTSIGPSCVPLSKFHSHQVLEKVNSFNTDVRQEHSSLYFMLEADLLTATASANAVTIPLVGAEILKQIDILPRAAWLWRA
jgi:hypothetical protein